MDSTTTQDQQPPAPVALQPVVRRRLWLLTPIEGQPAWKPWYDKAFGFVVRAESEEEARTIASENGGEERNEGHGNPWLDPKQSACAELLADGSPGIVMRNYAAA